MIKQKILDKPILIPVMIEASHFSGKNDLFVDRYNFPAKENILTFAVLPKDYTLMSMNIEVIEEFDTGFSFDVVAFDFNNPDVNEIVKNPFTFAKAIKLTKDANIQSSVITTLKKNQPVSIITNNGQTPTIGKAIVRIMMFAPASTYFEI